MSRKVKSVRVPEELGSLDITAIIRECERYLRDLESAIMLKKQGNIEASDVLLETRQADLGKKIARKIWEARVHYGTDKIAQAGKGKD